jgi:hypothetical protein
MKLNMLSKPEAVRYAEENGAEIKPTSDGRSFTVWWQPEDFDPKDGIVFVHAHGQAGWATEGFELWHKHLKERGWAYLGVQWWYGNNQEWIGYAQPLEIYRWTGEALHRHGVRPGRVIYEGFNMGSANSYAVTYIDRRQARPYFALTIANSGALEEDFAPNGLLLSKHEPSHPLAGSRWILYCGELDDVQRDACKKMGRTREQLEERGAVVHRFIREKFGTHEGMMGEGVLEPTLELADRIASGG